MTVFKVTVPDNLINSFKEYLLKIGAEYEEEFELSEDYKKMMDKLLGDHKNGKLEYLSEDEFKHLTAKK